MYWPPPDVQKFACKCGCGKVAVDVRVFMGLKFLADILHEEIVITSAFRCPEHNRRVGGSPNSQHMLGSAVDITVKGIHLKSLLAAIEEWPPWRHGGIGLDATQHYIHADVRENRARWGIIQGRTVSIESAIQEINKCERKQTGNTELQ